MKSYAVPFLVLGIVSLPSSGCMMAMQGMDHGPSHQTQGHAKIAALVMLIMIL